MRTSAGYGAWLLLWYQYGELYIGRVDQYIFLLPLVAYHWLFTFRLALLLVDWAERCDAGVIAATAHVHLSYYLDLLLCEVQSTMERRRRDACRAH